MITAHRPVVALAVIVLLTSCGGDDAGTGGATTPTPTIPITGSATTGTSTTTPPTEPDDDRVPGVPWGPDDPPIPDQYGALAATSDAGLDCATVEQEAPENDFWATVIAVCHALQGTGDWPTSGVTDPPPGANQFQDCLNAELATMLRALFEWRAEHPGAQPEIAYPPASARSPCELRLYVADVYEVDAGPERPTGGVVVELAVPGLVEDDPDPAVLVDGERVELDDDFDGAGDGLSTGAIYIPAPIEAHIATIEVETYFATLRTTVELPDVGTTDDDTTTTST